MADAEANRSLSVVAKVEPIKDRLFRLLEDAGKKPAWLAQKAGLSRSTVTRALSGDRAPTPETLATLAPVLGVTLEQLVAGTDAAARVDEAAELVAKEHYEAAVRQVVKFEREANELRTEVRTLQEELREERDCRKRAESLTEATEGELSRTRHDLEREKEEAARYREAFERAMADIARMKTEIEELGVAVDRSRKTGRVAAILAGAAAAASVATYLGHKDHKGKRTRTGRKR